MTPGEKSSLLRELAAIQRDTPGVVVSIDWSNQTRVAQDRVDEIERMLTADIAVRTPAADLGE